MKKFQTIRRHAALCSHCKEPVRIGEGAADGEGGSWVVRHRDCPSPAK